MDLLKVNDRGIYCPQADIYIDPWRPVKKALITHGHSDHARWGHKHYLCTPTAKPVIQYRIPDAQIDTQPYGKKLTINGVQFSFHPAGHVLGSAQIRAEYKRQIWVVTGDYKTQSDPLAEDYESVSCTHMISECTFGLPIFKWQEEAALADEINSWWKQCQNEGKVALLGAYALGKAQRLLYMLDSSIGTIYTHGAVENTNEVMRAQGIRLPETVRVSQELSKKDFRDGIVIAPPSAFQSSWVKKFQPFQTAMASGWMALRGNRRRRNMDRGFVISDHADWPGLNAAIEASGAEHVYMTHGYSEIFSKWLREEKGLNAQVLQTDYGQDEED